MDAPMAVMGGYAIFIGWRFFDPHATYRTIKRETMSDSASVDIINLALTLTVVILTKPTGVIYWFVIFVIALYQFIFQMLARSYSFIWQKYVVLAIPVIFFGSWQARVAVMGTKGQGSFNFDLLMRFFLGNQETWQVESQANFLQRIMNEGLMTLQVPFMSSESQFILKYWHIAIVLILLAIALAVVDKFRHIAEQVFIVVVGMFAYAFMMLIAYQSQFGEGEATALAGYDRYLLTMPVSLITFLVLITIQSFEVVELPWSTNKKRNSKRLGVKFWARLGLPIAICLFLFSLCSSYTLRFLMLGPLNYPDSSSFFEPFGRKIIDNTEIGSNVQIISETNPQSVWLNYEIFQHNPTNASYSEKWGSPPMETAIANKAIGYLGVLTPEDQVSKEDFADFLVEGNTDYIFFLNYDEYFAETYGSLFPNFAQYQLYKVNPDRTFDLLA
ncbi:MAG: hypothetical protein LBC43_03810 [Bifidobacteriaceae bacterium]|nr:hypothetical protein [Bifidobacteriaceae bacterium]